MGRNWILVLAVVVVVGFAGCKDVKEKYIVSPDTIPPTTTAVPPGGTYTSAQNVVLITDETATICYTTDGTDPDEASSVYSTPIIINSDTTLKFFAKDTAGNSEAIKTQNYAFASSDTIPPTTTAIPPGGTYTSAQNVVLFTDEPATIYYTTNGSDPDETSSVYSAPITISSDTTLKFFAKDTAGNSEAIKTQNYVFAPSDTTPPTATAIPPGGTYNWQQNVVLFTDEPATIYYTTDGTDPDETSSVYSTPINIISWTTLKFFAKDTAGNSEIIKTEIYTIIGDYWITGVANMPTARQALTSSAVNGKIYVIGGTDGSALNTVEEYDPATDTWKSSDPAANDSTPGVQDFTPMPTARYNLTSSAVNGKIYVIGGWNGFARNTVEEYDPATDTWTTKANMPAPRYILTSSVVNGKIYAIGGNLGGPLNTVQEYDPVANSWTPKTPMPTARYGLTSSVVNGKIYAIGGHDGVSQVNTVQEYDPVANSWIPKTPMPTARYGLTSSVVDDKIYAIGGVDSSVLNTVEEYDPATDTWTTELANMPTARVNLTSSAVNGKIYAIGGGGGSANEEYTPPAP
jgi:N-acetylneuraminic acid mutarotase